jgi:hypothetical protein
MKLVMRSASLLAYAIATYAFLSPQNQEKKKQASFTYYWWDYFGSTFADQYDATFYTLDADQVPDCSPTISSINCEIYALKATGNPDYPDMTSIIARRYPQGK